MTWDCVLKTFINKCQNVSFSSTLKRFLSKFGNDLISRQIWKQMGVDYSASTPL